MIINSTVAEHSKYKRIWNKLTELERSKLIKKAHLGHILIRNTLEWGDIESNYQSKLRDVMRVSNG